MTSMKLPSYKHLTKIFISCLGAYRVLPAQGMDAGSLGLAVHENNSIFSKVYYRTIILSSPSNA